MGTYDICLYIIFINPSSEGTCLFALAHIHIYMIEQHAPRNKERLENFLKDVNSEGMKFLLICNCLLTKKMQLLSLYCSTQTSGLNVAPKSLLQHGITGLVLREC